MAALLTQQRLPFPANAVRKTNETLIVRMADQAEPRSGVKVRVVHATAAALISTIGVSGYIDTGASPYAQVGYISTQVADMTDNKPNLKNPMPSTGRKSKPLAHPVEPFMPEEQAEPKAVVPSVLQRRTGKVSAGPPSTRRSEPNRFRIPSEPFAEDV